jgi:hypothetical protein
MRRATRAVAAAMTLLTLAACVMTPSPTPAPAPTDEPTATAQPSPSAASTASATTEPTATPEPELSLDLPEETDERVITVEVTPRVGEDGGEIIVSVTSEATKRIDELVLRWPTELGDSLFLAPFIPSDDRIRENGPPLVQDWTKWVIGPGEEGEPAGTISLGYGPLMPGATLRIPLSVTRRAAGAVSFDLQLLADNALLNLPGGEPAELRVRVP